jgi:sphingomyelin phosphodiesterase 2
MTLIKDHAGLRDAWVDTHPNAPAVFPPNMAPLEALHTFGVTADSPINTYSAGKPLDEYARQFLGKRLDYVLYRPPIHSLLSSKTPVLEPTQSDVVFTEHVPGNSYSYSDHFGLEATFSIRLPEGQPGDVKNPSDIEVPAPAPNTITKDRPSNARFDPSQQISAVPNLQPHLPPGLSDTSITTTIQALTACYRISRSRSRLYLSIFLCCLLAIVALIVGSAWLPHSWINPIFLLATTVLAWWATTMLYVGFIYGNWEVNVLANIIEELELYKETARRD